MDDYSKLAIALGEAGIEKGSVLIFEATGENLASGQAEDFQKLVAELQKLIGTNGTLVVPTCTPTEGYPKPTFDPMLSPSEMGPFSEFFRLEPNVVRSHSTTHSLAALGSLSEELIQGHRYAAGRPTPWGEGSFGKGSPWDWLYEHNAWWVLVDPAWSGSPSINYIQALYSEKHAGITKETCFPRFDAIVLIQELERIAIIRQISWNNHSIFLFKIRPMVDAALEVLDTDPQSLKPETDFSTWLMTVEKIHRDGYTMAGVAKAKITPPIPCLRWDGKQMTGVYRDLFARVVALSYRGNRTALVLCDLEAISGQIVGRIREQVQRQIGVPAEAIMIAATHAHSTPDTTSAGFENAKYIDHLVEAVAEGVCRAFSTQQPVRIGWGRVSVRGLAHSRRMRLTDGRVYTTRYGVPSTWRVNPDVIAGQGEIDPDITILKIESLDGEILASISNFGCHATVALVSTNISGDYPGEAMDTLEKVLGPQAVALCTIGTAGDVDPTLEMPFWGPRNDRNARHLGRIFAAQVLEHLERVKVQEVTDVKVAQEKLSLDVRREWIDLLQVDKDRLVQEFAEGWSSNPVLEQLLREKVIHTEVQGLRLNDMILLGLPGEVFVEIGGHLKNTIPGIAISIVELANENIGYIPTPKVWAEGGYEVGQHLWGRITLDGTDKLEAAARRIISTLAT
jgi:aminoglycoside N3'-acetyltransferase